MINQISRLPKAMFQFPKAMVSICMLPEYRKLKKHVQPPYATFHFRGKAQLTPEIILK